MKLVVDTNVLFSFFWKGSVVRQILMSPENDFVSAERAVRELKKYSSLIISKLGISKETFNAELAGLKSFVRIFPKSFYEEFLEPSEGFSPDKGDADFFAVCLKIDAPLWSNDKLLKNQDKVIVLNNEEVIDIL